MMRPIFINFQASKLEWQYIKDDDAWNRFNLQLAKRSQLLAIKDPFGGGFGDVILEIFKLEF